MGEKIKSFVDSFDSSLLVEISKQNDKKANFDRVRKDAIQISVTRSGSWPNDPSIRTIGDLLGYVFPASGGVINEPNTTIYFSGIYTLNPDFSPYQDDIKDYKSVYNDLKKYYDINLRLQNLKEKGGGQFWFDYFMYYVYNYFFKDNDFIKKIKDSNSDIDNDIYQLMPNGGSSVVNYVTKDLFSNIILNDSEYNSNQGVRIYLTNNLGTGLYDAFLEAGDNYVGPYTNDIKPPANFFKILDGDVQTNLPVQATQSNAGPTSSVSTTPSTPTSVGATPSAKIPLVVSDDIPESFSIPAKTDLPTFTIYLDVPPKKVYDDFTDLSELDPEYIEEETTALPEEPVIPEVVVSDPLIGDGADDTGIVNDQIVQPASGSVNDKQKAFIKNSLTNALPTGKGSCARYTYNHARNYKAQIVGDKVSKKIVPSGGNANMESYFKELVKLGYKRYDKGMVTTGALKSSLNSQFDIGDVVVYWGEGSKTLSPCLYGHTQIYTGGYNSSISSKGSNLWASDGITNYNTSFVYGRYKQIENWNYIIFKAPQPKASSQIA